MHIQWCMSAELRPLATNRHYYMGQYRSSVLFFRIVLQHHILPSGLRIASESFTPPPAIMPEVTSALVDLSTADRFIHSAETHLRSYC